MVPLKEIVLKDLFRYCGSQSLKSFLKLYFKSPGFKFMFWFRLTSHAMRENKWLYPFFRLKLNSLKYKYGYDILPGSSIEPGFYIGHIGGIVVTSKALIG